MNEATKYNRAKTWQIALFALNMMSTNIIVVQLSRQKSKLFIMN